MRFSRFGLALFTFCICSLARADITGRVKLDGKPPEMAEINMKAVAECAGQHRDPLYEESVVVSEKGELANVVISLKLDQPQTPTNPAANQPPVVIDQKGCQYVPHVVALNIGQTLSLRNDDSFLHNVHSLAQINAPFNVTQTTADQGRAIPEASKSAEIYQIKCDVHPWMNAWIVVVDNPFFAISDESGKFTIKGKIPDGTYTITAWHEQYGTLDTKITVKDGNAEANFAFKVESARNRQTDFEKKIDCYVAAAR